MQIPREFHRQLAAFIFSQIIESGPVPAPVDLAARCGDFCRRWFGAAEIGWTRTDVSLTELVSFSERLGKHVGEFYFNKKEG